MGGEGSSELPLSLAVQSADHDSALTGYVAVQSQSCGHWGIGANGPRPATLFARARGRIGCERRAPSKTKTRWPSYEDEIRSVEGPEARGGGPEGTADILLGSWGL